jgi:NAD(P)-dependent dehydrogenase (short-subunit alcohol dehydrogenase family)
MALATDVLRPGLLDGLRVVATGGPAPACAALGARVHEAAAPEDVPDDVEALVVDARRPEAGYEGFRAALDGAWDATRAAFHAGLRERGGIVVLLGPPPGDEWAAALRAALENTARSTATEWARFAVRPVAVLPGPRSSADEADALVAWLVSPAGAYFSGCAFTLR